MKTLRTVRKAVIDNSARTLRSLKRSEGRRVRGSVYERCYRLGLGGGDEKGSWQVLP